MLCDYSLIKQSEIIDNSIKNDYQGLFKPKEDKTKYFNGVRSTRDMTIEDELNSRSWAEGLQ